MRDVANELIHVGPLTMRFLVEAAQSGGSQTVFEVTVPAGARTRPAPTRGSSPSRAPA
jgi:hypothetical protein